MISITQQQLAQIAPKAIDVYKQAFAAADTALAPFGVNNTPLRLAHFMAQVVHESGGLARTTENLNYSAAALRKTWPKRFPDDQTAAEYAHKPDKIANYVYGGRMGNTEPGDGWKYIGRGLIQITGRANYHKYGQIVGAEFEAHPELVITAPWTLQVAAAFWQAAGCNAKADADDIVRVTKLINGGTIGLEERKALLAKAKAIWPA